MRPIRSAVLTVACIAALVGAAFAIAPAGQETAAPLPSGSPTLPDQRVKVDGKVYTKTARTRVKLTAKDLQLAHDGVVRHAIGRGIGIPGGGPNATWDPPDPSYPSPHDWWIEGEAYILHRQTFSGNPPVEFNYYRAGFDLWGQRGPDAFEYTFGDDSPALVAGDIYFALVEHPVGGTLTVNKTGPHKVYHSTPGNYHCDSIGPEILRAIDSNVVLRTNLVVRPVFVYWKSDDGTFHGVPYGQTRRMLQSKGLLADGDDVEIDQDYSANWSEFTGIPGSSGPYGNCAPETIQEP